MAKYSINGVLFTSKKAIKAYVKKKLESIGYGSYWWCDQPFLVELVKRHIYISQTKGGGICKYVLMPNKITGKGIHVEIIRRDTTMPRESLSWVSCATETFKKPQVSDAFRSAITQQIITYSRNNDHVCALCNTRDGTFQVDHHTPQFVEIRKEYERIHPAPKQFGKGYGQVTVFLDDEYNAGWSSYHQERAVLRILCTRCNQARLLF